MKRLIDTIDKIVFDKDTREGKDIEVVYYDGVHCFSLILEGIGNMLVDVLDTTRIWVDGIEIGRLVVESGDTFIERTTRVLEDTYLK